MRGQGEGALFRVPKDKSQPLTYWQGVIELPTANGERRRKFIRRKNKAALIAEMDKLRAQLRRDGDLPTAVPTVEEWFRYWLGNIGRPNLAPNTYADYEAKIRLHVIPVVGKVKLSKLTPELIRRVTDVMEDKGMSGTHRLGVHRTISAVLEDAVRERKIEYNAAKFMRAPRRSTPRQEALELDEAVRLLRFASTDDDYGARWATGLLTGARQGEVLGLETDRVGDVIDLSWQLQRIRWSHGCGLAGYAENGSETCRCGFARGADCPDRTVTVPADYEHRQITGGLYWTRPKPRAAWRIIPLVEPLRSIVEAHIERSGANPYGVVFAHEDGRPIDRPEDSERWHSVLRSLGISRHIPQHGLRHTTVDLLYMAGVPEDMIEQIVGHSARSTSRSYQTRGMVNRQRLNRAMTAMSELLRDDRDLLR